ncbi:MAG: alanine dehydrogenase [Planctomycetes bacterium]|nr:alanine dehydrogenase [Planctomycetota bacterium]
MIVSTLREIKKHEYRVGLTPSCVLSYVRHGHEVLIESGAGGGAGFEDSEYREAGATIVSTREEVFARAEMIVKVKEPMPEEFELFREGQILYTYLHLAANKKLTEFLMKRKIQSVAYETIEDDEGNLPCLQPMSEIAGRLSVQEGAKYLEKTFGGRGILLGGVPGVRRGRIAILGGGIVGTNACKMAVGIGAQVTVLDINAKRMAYLDDIFGSSITTLYSTEANLESILPESDVIIGAVLVPGASAPQLIRREHLARMKPGTVLVDVAIDQGGCFETSHPTTHDDPVYIEEGIVHYCVANMPGAVALSSTLALTSTTLGYGLMIADVGLEPALAANPGLARGLNVYKGACVYKNVADSLKLPYTPAAGLNNG